MDTSKQQAPAPDQTPTRTRSGRVPPVSTKTPTKSPQRPRDQAILNAPKLDLNYDPQIEMFDSMIALQTEHRNMGEILFNLQKILMDLPPVEQLNTAESRDHRLKVLNVAYRLFNKNFKMLNPCVPNMKFLAEELRDHMLDYLKAKLMSVLSAGADDKQLRTLLQMPAYGTFSEIVDGVVDAVIMGKLGDDDAIDKHFKSFPLPKALEIMSKPKMLAPVEEEVEEL